MLEARKVSEGELRFVIRSTMDGSLVNFDGPAE